MDRREFGLVQSEANEDYYRRVVLVGAFTTENGTWSRDENP